MSKRSLKSCLKILPVFLALFSFGLQGDRKNNNTHFIQVLNHHSRPVVGKEWTVHFVANGNGELVIENFNPDEVEFVGLECESVVVVGGRGMITSRKVKGLRQEGSRTTVDWHYGMGRAILRPLKPGGHKVELAFGGSKDRAFNQATEVVSTESTDTSKYPAIAVDSTNVYIAWEDDTNYGGSGTDKDIFFKSKPIGGSWPVTTEVVSSESTGGSYNPTIAVDSTNVYITWYDWTNYGGSGTDQDVFFKSKPIHSPTITATATPTVSPTRTWSPTSTASPTLSTTPTFTKTATGSFTLTTTPTITSTATITETGTEPATPTTTPTITPTPRPPDKEQLFISRNIFNPNAGETVEIRWSALGPGRASLVIYNTAGELVRRLMEKHISNNGVSETVAWDGRNEKGDLVASGVYIIYLHGKRSFLGKVAVVK